MEDSEESDITQGSLIPSPVPSESSSTVSLQRKCGTILCMTAVQTKAFVKHVLLIVALSPQPRWWNRPGIAQHKHKALWPRHRKEVPNQFANSLEEQRSA